MSLAAIRAGLFTTLTACGPWASAEISACCFDPLQSTNACAIVFLPGRSEITPQRLGTRPARGYLRRWSIEGVLYVKDTGDPRRTLGNVWQGIDDLYTTIAKDDTLASSACAAHVSSINFDRNTFIEAAGQIWAPVSFTVEAEEF